MEAQVGSHVHQQVYRGCVRMTLFVAFHIPVKLKLQAKLNNAALWRKSGAAGSVVCLLVCCVCEKSSSILPPYLVNS